MGKSTTRLARSRRGIDPWLVKKLFADFGKVRRELAIGIQHQRFCGVPRNFLATGIRERRVAVPVIELTLAEPARLQLVIAMRQIGIGFPDGRRQGVDNHIFDMVGEIARRLRPRIAAPAIIDFLILGQRVGDQAKQLNVLTKRLAQRFGSLFADLSVIIRQAVQDFLGCLLPAIHIDSHARYGLIKQTVPRGTARDMLVMQKPFGFFIELMRAKDPDIADPRRIVSQRRSLEFLLERCIAELIDLQRKEHKMRRNIGHCFLHRLIEPADLGVGDISCMD